MSVSLLRLNDGRIAMFYLRKNSLTDCRPVMRTSNDEAKTWSDPIEIIPKGEIGYYVLNNDRVVQLENGRVVIPLAQHHGKDWKKWTAYGEVLCYFSDDRGRTWKQGKAAGAPSPVKGKPVMTQEPGVVALTDGRLMMWCRTDAGSQYVAHSKDKGESWSKLEPSSIISPRSPATIERIPKTGDLLLIWNNHQEIPQMLRGKRTPLTLALSSDDGRTWRNIKPLEVNPHGWYCYTAIAFLENDVLLAHSAGDRRKNNGLALTQVTRFPVKWLNADLTSKMMRRTPPLAGVKQLIAHRGSSADRPECTLASIQRAIEAGATAVEVDVRSTKDGKLVILHDATLDRTTNGFGPVQEKTLAEVKQLDAGSWFDPKYSLQRVPTLKEVFALCGNKIDVLLDLKVEGEDFAKIVAAEVKGNSSPKRTIIGVRSIEQARRFRKLLPEARQLGLIPNAETIEAFANEKVEMIRLWPKWLKQDAALVQRVRTLGAKLHLNGTTGTPDDILPLLKHQPDSLSTDDPARLVKTLAKVQSKLDK